MDFSSPRRSLSVLSMSRRLSLSRAQLSLSKTHLGSGTSSIVRSDGLTLRLADKVTINACPQEVQRLSKGHGGWKDEMAQYSFKVGIIHRFTESGDVRVRFGLNKAATRFTFNPDVLKVIYLVGDFIETSANISDIRQEQAKRQGCTRIPEEVDISNKITLVKEVSDDQSTLLVTIHKENYWLSFNCIKLRISNNKSLAKMIDTVHPMYDDSPLVECTPSSCPDCKINVWKAKYQELLEQHTCSICFEEMKNMIFGCGHGSCKTCSHSFSNCPICRKPIATKIEMF